MAKFVKEVEAEQYDPKAESPKEVIVNGASTFAFPGDYIVYDKGHIISVVSKAKFEAEHKPAEQKAAKESKKQ